MKNFALLLDALRIEKKISKRELASRAGLSPGYISLLIGGERTEPSKETLIALAHALELDKENRTMLFEAAGYDSSNTASFLGMVEEVSIPQKERAKRQDEITREDWNEAPNTRVFYGRAHDLAQLRSWIVEDSCQVVAVLGMGGIGKTLLVTRLAEHIKDEFDYVIWRSLSNAPPLKDVLAECIQFLSHGKQVDLPEREEIRITTFMKCLQKDRCLVVLDNFETILRGADRAGLYHEAYKGYSRLLRLLGEARHQSCVILTSREKPGEIAYLEGNTCPVRSIELRGVEIVTGRQLLENKNLFGSDENWARLIDVYAGNPLALKLVAEAIREVFGSDIGAFLAKGEIVFGDIDDLLDQHFERLMPLEQEIMHWLAIKREIVSLESLWEDLAYRVSERNLQTAIESLRRRSMIEGRGSGLFTLQPVILEYVTDRFVERVCWELEHNTNEFFARFALIQARAKDYLRNAQVRHILQPLANRLVGRWGRERTTERLNSLLLQLREADKQAGLIDYTAGNVLNLLIELKVDLRGYNFSTLSIRQAYLQGVPLPQVNFAYAHLEHSVFTDTFSSILSVALSANERFLAAGTASGSIRLWDASGNTPLQTLQEHRDWVRCVAFSPDGLMLASSSDDQTIRLWDTSSGKCLKVLREHTNRVRCVAFSPDGLTLASSSDDQTIRLWDRASGECLRILGGHTGRVRCVAFSPDGLMLASGSDDQTIRLWNTRRGECLRILVGHTGRVRCVAFSPDGLMLASGSDDQTIRLWRGDTGICFQTLHEHSNIVRSLAFSPQGSILASGSEDRTIRFWETATGQCFRILTGHFNAIRSVAFAQDGNHLVSGGDDQTVRFWEASTGQCIKTVQGHKNWIYSVAFSPDGLMLASGHQDYTVHLWDVLARRDVRTLRGHNGPIYTVSFSPDGRTLASSSQDHTINLWDISSGYSLGVLQGHTSQVNSATFNLEGNVLASGGEDNAVRLWDVHTRTCLRVLQGHSGRVRSVAFHPAGTLLASGSEDATICLWEMNTGRLLSILRGHTNQIRSVTFNKEGTLLASACEDTTLRLWDVSSGLCTKVLQGHSGRVRSVGFHSAGMLVASASEDTTIRLWEVSTGNLLKILQGHNGLVYSVAFNPQGTMVASGSYDGTIKLWNVEDGECLQTLVGERPYEGMNIKGVRGLSDEERIRLSTLGAIAN